MLEHPKALKKTSIEKEYEEEKERCFSEGMVDTLNKEGIEEELARKGVKRHKQCLASVKN